MHSYRTHTCQDLRLEHVGQQARLSGWVHRVRDHGGIIFIDLRDHYGITQVVIHPDQDFYKTSERWRLETVLCFTGSVVERSEETRNEKLATGDIELHAEEMTVLAEAEIAPFSVAKEEACDENLRLQYRFIDLRRERMHRNIMLRSGVISEARRLLEGMGFNEFQTPILTASSPEGARDYLVPSRLHPGNFYALPQAPQLYKQMLMVSGFDRYFQIAPCFRDEDARADRSPGEFYQIDIEMSFATQEDIFHHVEELLHGLFTRFSDRSVTDKPFPRLTYAESMLKYGTDKPDLRIPIEIQDVTELFRDSDFKAFASEVANGGVIRALPVHGIGDQPRSFFDSLIEFAQSKGGKGLGYLVWTEEGIQSPITKFLDQRICDELRSCGNMSPGDVMFFVADKQRTAEYVAGEVRLHLADMLDLITDSGFQLCWVTDYPMFEWDEERERVTFSHNPFSMPQGGLEALEQNDPLEVKAYQYDVVCNGVELSSGAIRNHRPDIMYRAFEIGGYSREELERRFSGLLRAMRYGAPPHGGIAPGLERIIMLLAGESNIREVTPFPLNQSAQDPLLGAPAPATDKQLNELKLRVLPQNKQSGTKS